MASDSVNIVASLGGELITYLPASGGSKQFKAVVDRRPQGVDASPAGSYPANMLELLIPHDATNGVESIKERFDKVTFKRWPHDSGVSTFTITKVLQADIGIIASDGGMFRVMVQA